MTYIEKESRGNRDGRGKQREVKGLKEEGGCSSILFKVNVN